MPNDLLAWGLGMLVLVVVLAGFAGASHVRKVSGRSHGGGGGGYAYPGSSKNDDNSSDGGGSDGGGGGDGGGD